MSSEKPPINENGHIISSRDLFGSIPKPLDVDPFEGIDIDDISIYMKPTEGEEDDDIDLLNPLEGIDVSDITGTPKDKAKEEDENGGFSLEGIDPEYISVKADPDQDYRLPVEEDESEAIPSEKKPVLQQDTKKPSEPENQREFKGNGSGSTKWLNIGQLPSNIKKFGTNLTKKFKPFSKSPPRLSPANVPESTSALAGRLRNGYVYSEINRIRENLVGAVEKENRKTVVFASPHDDAGTTFLIGLLGFNIAYQTSMKTLLVDLNMRRPQLQIPFGLEIENGFCEVARGTLEWEDAIKDTGLSGLKMLTCGKRSNELYLTLTPSLLENMINEMKKEFDLILFDTSPLLNQNKNNVDPVFLSLTCDMVVMVVQDKVTTTEQLTEAVTAITRDGGTVDGVVYNHQF